MLTRLKCKPASTPSECAKPGIAERGGLIRVRFGRSGFAHGAGLPKITAGALTTLHLAEPKLAFKCCARATAKKMLSFCVVRGCMPYNVTSITA